jgi:hypothetical protein
MIRILQNIGVVQSDNSEVRTAPAIVMMGLLLTFVGAIIYILISSLSS